MLYNEAMLKNILTIIALFIIGMGGGIFADQIFWPYIVERPLFFAYRLDQAPVYVTERKEITIQENTALQDAVEKVEKAVVGIQTKTQALRFSAPLLFSCPHLRNQQCKIERPEK